MTDALVLASRLRALDDDALADLVRDRGVDAARVDDLFDLADALLAPDAVARALEQLDRTSLAVLAVACAEGAASRRVPLSVVRDAIARRSGEDPVDAEVVADAARRASATLLAGLDEDGITTHPEVQAEARILAGRGPPRHRRGSPASPLPPRSPPCRAATRTRWTAVPARAPSPRSSPSPPSWTSWRGSPPAS
ncbi:hypothetical protein [Clavibacter tessellarius]|uniref:hypothetical protein n=1 Tax=Clavibacter tessellarius TaxID=31965 RepID=UPI0032432BD7